MLRSRTDMIPPPTLPCKRHPLPDPTQQASADPSASLSALSSRKLSFVSSGPPQDPRFFYSTTYSTTHNVSEIAARLLREKQQQTVEKRKTRKAPSEVPKQRTGYSKNVQPFVEYSKVVDGAGLPSHTTPFATTNGDVFTIRSRPKDYVRKYVEGEPEEPININKIVPTGFMRVPKEDVTKDGMGFRSMVTTSKTAHRGEGLQFKTKYLKQATVPSNSAHTNDVGHIDRFGVDDLKLVRQQGANGEVEERLAVVDHRFYKPPPAQEPDWRMFRATRMDKDGFSRSCPADPLKASTTTPTPMQLLQLQREIEMMQRASSTQVAAYINARNRAAEKVQKVDLAEWVYTQDPGAKRSTSSIVHPNHEYLLRAQRNELNREKVAIGLKEETGSVRNNPICRPSDEIEPVAVRFTTETVDRYREPDPDSHKRFSCDSVHRSGYSLGNKYKYLFDVKPEDLPVIAREKSNWIGEKVLPVVDMKLPDTKMSLLFQKCTS
ncbi:hypothetical protein BJ742DRAFT_806557 [Cladochytrium replicatum]|nr:hypothetical protein BJ742DRAFT_806557 [Cladochytrium replicatum]